MLDYGSKHAEAAVPEFIQSILETRLNPHQQHAMWVHLPIAIAVVGAAGLLAFTLTAGRLGLLRWCCVFLYGAGFLIAQVTARLGAAAMQNLDPSVMTDAALEHLEAHESMGERVPMLLGVTAVLVLLTAIPNGWTRLLFLSTSLIAGVGALGWVTVTAHYGGTMVYRFGVGVPATVNNVAAFSPEKAYDRSRPAKAIDRVGTRTSKVDPEQDDPDIQVDTDDASPPPSGTQPVPNSGTAEKEPPDFFNISTKPVPPK
jgi:uncharacterized membrane protein